MPNIVETFLENSCINISSPIKSKSISEESIQNSNYNYSFYFDKDFLSYISNSNDYKNTEGLIDNSNKWEYNKIKDSIYNIGVSDDMPNNDELLLKLIDNIEKSNKALKQDIVEMEKRSYENINQSEKRTEKNIENLINLIATSEKNSEERIQRIENKLEQATSEMRNDIKNTTSWVHSLCLATIAAFVTVAVTVYLTLSSLP